MPPLIGSLLLPLPVLAIAFAALDSALVRWSQPWQPSDARLFFHAYFLWAVFGLLALLPAALTLRLWEGRRRAAWSGGARPWMVQLAWMGLPVLAHATLDRHTSLVGLAGLSGGGPWIELGAVLAGSLALLAGFMKTVGPLPGSRTAAIGVLLAVGVGLFFRAGHASTPAPRTPAAGTAPESSPAASTVQRPNLLLLVLDTCRSDRLEPYGCERPTSPGLQELAREALVFEDSLSSSSFTFTSHLSLLTGVRPSTHGARLANMRYDPARAASIAALLAEQGYRTAAFVGTDVLCGRTGIGAGFEHYDDAVDPAVCETFAWRAVHDLQSLAAGLVPALRFDGRPHWIQDFQRPADEVLARARAWIGRRDPRPWFCLVNLYDVHWPYEPRGRGRELLVRPYDGPVDGRLFRSHEWVAGYRMDAADVRHVSDLYEGEVFDLDHAVSAFLDGLELGRGKTAVLVTADHGEGLGEEDTWNHDGIREPQVRVPLLLRLPEPRPSGARSAAPVTGLDVAPTLLGLAGLVPPPAMEGLDLLRQPVPEHRERWIEDRDHLDPADVRLALYRGPWKLARLGAGADARYELYDLSSDSVGTRDVSRDNPGLFAELVQCFERVHGPAADERPTASREAAVASDALQGLGYVGN